MTVVRRPNGHKWIQFRSPHGSRHTIRLGVVTDDQARAFNRRILDLLSFAKLGQVPSLELATWLADLPRATHDRIAATGLVDRKSFGTLGELIDGWKAASNWNATTAGNLAVFCGNLEKHFGRGKPIAAITPAAAREFHSWLKSSGGR